MDADQTEQDNLNVSAFIRVNPRQELEKKRPVARAASCSRRDAVLTQPVGWAERSEAQRSPAAMLGIAALSPACVGGVADAKTSQPSPLRLIQSASIRVIRVHPRRKFLCSTQSKTARFPGPSSKQFSELAYAANRVRIFFIALTSI
jgi:hypothetical protein